MSTAAPLDDAPHLVDDLERAIEDAERATSARLLRRDVPRTLLVRATIPDLLRQALFEWALLIGLWALMVVAPWWADVPLMLLVAGRLHAFGVILHDATHMPLRDKTLGIRLLAVLVGYPIATTLEAMRYHHLRHHKDSGMPTDPYFKAGVETRRSVYLVQWLRGILLMPFWTVRAPYGFLASAVPALRPSYARVFLQDRSGASSAVLRQSREVMACARAELGQMLFQIPLAIAFVIWPEVLLWYYALPATVTGLLASYRVLCEHRYVAVRDRRLETILATTRDHHISPFAKLFLAPRNIGYHVVHHLHPQVAQQYLPTLRAFYRARLGPDYDSVRY